MSNDVVELLQRIDARLERLERRLEVLESVEPALAVAVDTLDDHAARLQAQGVDIDARLERALALSERLTRPETLRGLEHAVSVAEELPGLAAMAVDTVDAAAARAQAQGVDVDRRLQTVLELGERLSRPETAAAIAHSLDLAEQAPGMVATAVDTLDALVVRMGDGGFDVDERMHGLISAADFLTRAELVRSMENVADSLQSAQCAPKEEISVFALMRALKDPEIARTVSFALCFARQFGQTLPS